IWPRPFMIMAVVSGPERASAPRLFTAASRSLPDAQAIIEAPSRVTVGAYRWKAAWYSFRPGVSFAGNGARNDPRYRPSLATNLSACTAEPAARLTVASTGLKPRLLHARATRETAEPSPPTKANWTPAFFMFWHSEVKSGWVRENG